VIQHAAVVFAFAGPGNGWGLFGAIMIGLVLSAVVGELLGRRAARRDRQQG
jgi:hypothetical protein